MADVTVMKSETVGTVRTTVNMTVLTLIATVIARYTNWSVEVEDLLPYTPLISGAVLVFYRLSLYVSQKFTWIGVVLYGINSPPKYVPPAPPLDNPIILPPDQGEDGGFVQDNIVWTVVGVLLIIALLIWIIGGGIRN